MTDKPHEIDLLEDFLNKSFKIKDKELKINGKPKNKPDLDEYFDSLLKFKTREANSIKKFVATEFSGSQEDYYNFIIDNDNPILNCDYDMINKLMFFLRLKKYRNVLKLLTIYLEILSLRLQKILKVEEEAEPVESEAEAPVAPVAEAVEPEAPVEAPAVAPEAEPPAEPAEPVEEEPVAPAVAPEAVAPEAPAVAPEAVAPEAPAEAPAEPVEAPEAVAPEAEPPAEVAPVEPAEPEVAPAEVAPVEPAEPESKEDKNSEELELEIKYLDRQYKSEKKKLNIKVPFFANYIKKLSDKLYFFKEVMSSKPGNPNYKKTFEETFEEIVKTGMDSYYESFKQNEAIFQKIFNNKPIRKFETHQKISNPEEILTEITKRTTTGLETNAIKVKYQNQVDYEKKELYSNEDIFQNILNFDYNPPPPESCNDITKLFNEGIKKILSDINRYFNHIYFYINLSSILMSKVDLHTKKLSTYSDNMKLIDECVETFENLSCYEDIKSKETLQKIKNKENIYRPDYEEIIVDFEKFKNLNRELNNIFKIL